MIAFLLACKIAAVEPHIPTHEVDVIEFNHMWSWDQEDVKWELDLCQLIVWKDSKLDTVGFCEKCLDWHPIVDRTKKGAPIYPTINKRKDGRWETWIEFRGVRHHIIGHLIRFTHTEHDPELWHRKTFGREKGLWRD